MNNSTIDLLLCFEKKRTSSKKNEVYCYSDEQKRKE